MAAPGQPSRRDPQHGSRAFYASCAFGAVGVVVVLVGIATASNGVALAGYVLGTLSLVAALAWRSELIQAWRSRKGPPRNRAGQSRPRRPGSPGSTRPRSS